MVHRISNKFIVSNIALCFRKDGYFDIALNLTIIEYHFTILYAFTVTVETQRSFSFSQEPA